MDYIGCHPILENIKGDFNQLHGYIVNAQNYITSWQLKNQRDNLLFEVPLELLEPLDNLSKLTLYLLENTSLNLNGKQLQVLMAWERAVAVCYCFIQEFIRLKCTSKGKPKWIRNQAELEELTYEFYLYASSELRTQFSSLHMFSEIFKAYPSDYFVPPLVPKHKETLSQIDNRIDQLLEFSATWTEKMKNIYVKKEKRMNVQKVIQSQYLASLAMMRQVIELCPAAMWDDRAVKNRYWQVAYHGLFFIHFYLQPTEADFVPWEKHQPHYDDMGIGGDKEPCNQADMLAYLALVEEQVRSVVPILDLEAESGFHWLPFNKLELQFYSMRHLMGHVGELSERLWVQAGVEVEWVGKGE